jgi:Sulfatase
VVGEIATGFPGYDSISEKGTIGTILKDNGYATAWFGKDHNTASFQSSQVGPFDQWPNGMGFDYFYGFVGGDASQWQPNLFRNTTAIYPFQDNPGWNLETAMADDAIQYIKQLKEIAPGRDAIHGGSGYDAAECARRTKPLVVGHDQKHVRRTLRRHDARRPPRRGLRGFFIDHTPEFRIGRGKLVAGDRGGGLRRALNTRRLLTAGHGRKRRPYEQAECQGKQLSIHRRRSI